MKYLGYKITNTKNNKFYIGVHKGEDDDDYMGSGTHLWNAYRKELGRPELDSNIAEHRRFVKNCGKFIKETIRYFSSEDEMYEWETEIVNQEFVEREDTYNENLGGHGGWSAVNNSVYIQEVRSANGRKNVGLMLTQEVIDRRAKTWKESDKMPEHMQHLVELAASPENRAKAYATRIENDPETLAKSIHSKEARLKTWAKYKFKTESGDIVLMDRTNGKRHKGWECLGPADEE